MTIGENIRNKRLEYDIEQQELAQRIGVSKAMLCGIEKGGDILPRLKRRGLPLAKQAVGSRSIVLMY